KAKRVNGKPTLANGKAKLANGRAKKPPLSDARLALALLARLAETLPEPRCELDHENAWQLLIATILSAQSTDARVNIVTPELFRRYPTPAALGAADRK